VNLERTIRLANWAHEFAKSTYRYNIIYGGRGSGKSYTIADILILKAYNKRETILCGREFFANLGDSVHTLLVERIEALGLTRHFIIKQTEIICKHNKSRFFFKGLRLNARGLKSVPNITHLWIEEADTLSAESWRIIRPTLRLENSQIWISLNPTNKEDCLYKQFIADPEPQFALVRQVNWSENPFFPNVLEQERQVDMAADADMYQHIWEGKPLQHSDALIFKGKWVVDDFEEDSKAWAYYGLDFGFIDPTAAIRSYIKDNTLYITHELYKRQIEVNEIGKACEKNILGFKTSKIIADNARPDTISGMRQQGYNVKPSEKGKGSIEDGIAFLRSFDRIVVHPRCEFTRRELGLYSYKVDERSGDVTNKIIDSNNHIIDALRYSLESVMKRNVANYSILSKM
jgi:phage terminase large subunit